MAGAKKKRIFKRCGSFYVYILECQDGTYYTGYTNNLKNRIKRHNDGLASKYTRSRLPVNVVWRKEYIYFKSAFLAEKRIKQLTRRQKEKIVRGMRLDKVLEAARRIGTHLFEAES